ncbi:MAG: thiamine phosphate synthase [Syntrophales bacterium]
MNRALRREKFLRVDLYPVTCERLSAGRSNLEVLEAAIRGGAKIIQLREKELPVRDLYRMACAFRKITAEAGMLLIINDRVDIALAADADGVHLGQDDLPLSAARRIAPELLIGISTHTRAEALQAQSEGADYVNIGPIFPTATKEGVNRFLGPEAIPGIAARLEIPFTVMGGIGAANIVRVVGQGAHRVAVVTAVTMAVDMAAAVAALRETIRSSRVV